LRKTQHAGGPEVSTGTVVIRKANTYRLYPTSSQEQKMAQIAGACRFVYNIALEQRSEWYRPGRSIGFVSQCREITILRSEVDWLKAAPVSALQQSLRDLDGAFKRYFDQRPQYIAEEARRKAAGTWKPRKDRKPLGYPTRRRKSHDDAFRFAAPKEINIERTGKSSARIKLPKLGWISLRGWRVIPGEIRNATVSRRAGRWHVSVQWQREAAGPAPSTLPSVGIDRGVAVFAALSDGIRIAPVNHGKTALRALRKSQREMSRKKLGSSNRRKATRRVARIQMRVANARKDFLHKHSTTIAKNHGTVVVEALKVQNMSASS
jgi:putative transposase